MLNINQIRRCETVFSSNTDAIDYIIQNTKSLYGEPLVVRYGDEEEWEKHFQYLLPFFKDKRYQKYNNKPIFMVFICNFYYGI